MQFIFSPIWGRLSDRIGRRPILLMSTLGSFISYIIYAFAGHLWILYFSRMLQGTFAANISVAQAYVADVTTKENRSKGMGLVGAGIGMGFVLGPAFGALLMKVGHWIGESTGQSELLVFKLGFPALGAALFSGLNLLFIFFKLPEGTTAEQRAKALGEKESRFQFFKKVLAKKDLGWLVLSLFLATFALASMESTFALFGQARLGYGIVEVGGMMAFIGVAMAVTQGYLVRKLQPKYKEFKMILWGYMLSAVGFCLVTLSQSTGFLAFAVTVMAVGTGLSNPALFGSISLGTKEEDQGSMMGINQSMGSLARMLGPAAGTFVFGWHIEAPLLLSAFVTVWLALYALRNHRNMPTHV